MSSGLSPDNDIQITGATDNTNIGNDGTYLHVVTKDGNNSSATPGAPTYSTKYRSVVDETSQVLTASYQTVFSYSGSGKFIGFVASCESAATIYRLTIDGQVIFADVDNTTYSLLDLGKASNFDTGGGPIPSADGKRLGFVPRFPIKYTSSVLIEAKESTGKRHFREIVSLTKET